MIKYNVRSRQLIDIVGDIKRSKIILSPYFQRNLVWRQLHKVDFIKTILLGYPFPEIFIAKGGIDVENLSSISVIVDGQQRMNSIIEFINNEYKVDDKTFDSLTTDERDKFLKYEIAIIELDLESENPEIIEIFKRLNRTFYSLSTIEKLATEYAPSEFMLVAKLLTDEIDLKIPKDITINPNVTIEFIEWAKTIKVQNYHKLILNSLIFTPYETSRKVHLMMTLNILATILRGFFNRNLQTSMLDEYANSFPEKEDIINKLDQVAKFYLSLNFNKNSYWYNKANFFSLIIFIYNNFEYLLNYTIQEIKNILKKFENNIPNDYQLAAKEAVNNKRERILRNKYLNEIFLKTS